MNKLWRNTVLCLVVAVLFVIPISAVENEEKTTQSSYEIIGTNRCGCTIPTKMSTNSMVRNGVHETIDLTDSSAKPVVIDTPDYFNWMDYGGQDWTTSVKDQSYPQYCGSCFAFAALGVLESVINIREGIPDLDPDLSEQYVLSCLPRAGDCVGGSPHRTFKYILENTSRGNYCNGIIPEACFPYQASDTVPCTEKCENWEKYLIPILACDDIFPSTEELVKSTIIEKGPIVAAIFVNRNFSAWLLTHHSPDDYFPYEPETHVNHVLTIVGWKDDPSIGKGGYWICKNSWGSLYGYNGFCNIEYESLGIQTVTTMEWVDYDPASYDWHPTPKAHGPYYGLVNQQLQFKGNASGEHPPFTWMWDFGDGTTSDEQNPSHTYISPGEYEVTLTVTDENTQSFYDITSAWIQETNHPPETPLIVGTRATISGWGWYNFTVNDPDGSVIYLYWDVYDICPDLWDGPFPSNEEILFSRRIGFWNSSGIFTVRMKAKDPYGAESDWGVLPVIVAKNKEISPLFLRFVDRYQNLLPILKFLMNLDEQ